MTNTAAVLAKHQRHGMGMTAGSADTCSCGERVYPAAGEVDILVRRDIAFAEHQANALIPNDLQKENDR